MINIFKKEKKVPENLKEVLDQFGDLKKDFDKISKELKALKENSQFSIQKIGIMRFNPFPGVGGNQSFSLALLDASDDGVVITSLYNRDENRIYGKPVKNGQSQFSLTDEEKTVIEKAKNDYRNKEKLNSSTASGSGSGTY